MCHPKAITTNNTKPVILNILPLIWTMMNQHTVVFNGKIFNITGLVLLVVIVIGWHMVFQLYKKSTKVKGF